ncbi:MAG: hypothetical protein FWH47_01090 [Methanomassiliicoccaceae archaeon]|nr:hypothetical protein [Methanomassiliicoccaceae archaeon]
MYAAEIVAASDDAPGVASALGPEAGRDLPRTGASVRLEGGACVVRLTATDASAMRAALNAYLECIKVTEDIGRITR